jgi:DNA-binding LytR/AlgR family response regulator
VLKPVDVDRLSQAVARVKARLDDKPPIVGVDLQSVLQQLVGQVRRPAYTEVIQAGVGREVKLIRVDDVVFFESDTRYTRVVHADGEVLIRTPLKELLGQLDPARFWQIHRSVIVNQGHVLSAVRIDEGSMIVTLRGRSDKLPVSRHFQAMFRGQ